MASKPSEQLPTAREARDDDAKAFQREELCIHCGFMRWQHGNKASGCPFKVSYFKGMGVRKS